MPEASRGGMDTCQMTKSSLANKSRLCAGIPPCEGERHTDAAVLLNEDTAWLRKFQDANTEPDHRARFNAFRTEVARDRLVSLTARRDAAETQ